MAGDDVKGAAGAAAKPEQKPPAAPKKGGRRMRVRVLEKAWYREVLVGPGTGRDVIPLQSPADFSNRYMEIVDATPEQIAAITAGMKPKDFKRKKRITFVKSDGTRIRPGAALPPPPPLAEAETDDDVE